MRLVTFAARGRTRIGALAGDWVIDLTSAAQARDAAAGAPHPAAQARAAVPPSMRRFLAGGDDALALARRLVDDTRTRLTGTGAAALEAAGIAWRRGEVRLLPPVPAPPKILCVGRNYAEHAREGGSAPPEIPIFFGRFPHSLLGPGEPYVMPRASTQVDYEGELAVIIGAGGRDIPEARALEHVAGYAIFNDLSIRDYQRRTSQWMLGKNFDRSGPFGPALVTRDEVPDPQALTLTVDVSGERMQEADTSTMIFSVAYLIADVSRALTLEPGDVIATGTPSGVGFARTPPRWLRPGDLVRVEITGLGALDTPIIASDRAR
ncbi:MAG TPA: fumarylacetoacetate hydrolase family protein [bacterium]|nr:fumarylacetoacetate hydrolase family protein [bacterium]